MMQFHHFSSITAVMRPLCGNIIRTFLLSSIPRFTPPRKIGDPVRIMKGAHHSDADYAEIMRITQEFCDKYPSPVDFPKEF